MSVSLQSKHQPAALQYVVRPAHVKPALDMNWLSPAWQQAETVRVNDFHADSVSRHPVTTARVLYDNDYLYVHFLVQDRHVQSVHTNYQDSVCKDSCVEFFVRPKHDKGYFNYEFNCGGTMLLYYMEVLNDHYPFKLRRHLVPWEMAKDVKVAHSMPKQVIQPLHDAIDWTLEFHAPIALMEHYVGTLKPVGDRIMHANFYKCGGDKRYNHYASWASIGKHLDYHQPDHFRPLLLVE